MHAKSVISSVALGLVLSATAPTYASRGTCYQVYDADCTYCTGGDAWYCNNNTDYRWRNCAEYVGGVCVVHTTRCSATAAHQDPATQGRWIGTVNLVAASGTSSFVQGASCELFVNGSSRGTVLTAPDGNGVTANVGPLDYSVADGDRTSLCAHATIDGVLYTDCADGITTDLVAQPFLDLVDAVVDVARGAEYALLEPTACDALLEHAAAINAMGQPTIIWIDNGDPKPSGVDSEGFDNDSNDVDGDVFLLGHLAWDCPWYSRSVATQAVESAQVTIGNH
jgi:hypothetical protein